MENQEEAKLQRFLQWLQANRVDLRGCKIKYCGPTKGFGLFYSENHNEGNCDCKFSGILLVVPLDLAITPMRVLQDPSLGPKCRAMFEEGEVDDRFLMILLLTLERLRKNSAWKPYLDMLPSTFGNPLWFTDDEFLELKGTTLYRATELQKKNLQSLYEDKVKDLATKLFNGELEREMQFEDFLWANSIFWTRALNIPFPHSYVFPQIPKEQESCCSTLGRDSGAPSSLNSSGVLSSVKDKEGIQECEVGNGTEPTSSTQGETIWVEGLVPAIDFCNHGLKAAATWEVDGFGVTTGVPASMYLLSAEQSPFQLEKEILISYGNKGNEELLYLYGFVIDNNPDDYLMVHYPVEAIQTIPFADSKLQLLEVQKAEMRCLLPRSLLDNGFFPLSTQLNEDKTKLNNGQGCNYSWCGQHKMPSYLNKLVFPEDFLTALRTIAMKEEELFKVSSLLEELVGAEEERQPSNAEVRAAVWEACGDSGALQLLVDLLQTKMMELEEGTGTETSDSELLEKAQIADMTEGCMREQTEEMRAEKFMSRNRWSSIIYRRGQKRLTRLFLKEAEQALHLCLSEQS